MRRRLVLLAPLAACAQPSGQVAVPAVPAVPPAGPSFAPATAAPAMPAPAAMPGGGRALMAARVADGPELAMILAEGAGGGEQWLAPGPFVLALRAGRVTRTVNLPGRDLRGVVDETPDPLLRPERLGAAQAYRRRLQVAGSPPGGLVVESQLVAEGTEAVRVPGLGTSRTLRRVRETGRGLEGPVAGWRFENLFWLDPASGRVLASRQDPLPGAPTLALQVIRAG
jgi:hypothetical protein